MTTYQLVQLGELLIFYKSTVLVHGACCGADDQADELAASRGIDRMIFPSTFNTRVANEILRSRTGSRIVIAPPDEPLRRNVHVVDNGSILFAAPSGTKEILRSGTWATVRYARKIGKEIVMIWR